MHTAVGALCVHMFIVVAKLESTLQRDDMHYTIMLWSPYYKSDVNAQEVEAML
jgi:hypothetical protein